jgi:hypothetical protein
VERISGEKCSVTLSLVVLLLVVGRVSRTMRDHSRRSKTEGGGNSVLGVPDEGFEDGLAFLHADNGDDEDNE